MTNKQPLIIGLSGKIGSGKNYIAENIISTILPNNYIPIYLAFADQIKVEVYCRDIKNMITYDNLYINKNSDVRKELQKYGTDIGRNESPEIWVKALDLWITLFQNRWTCKTHIPVFIITDVRFENEANYIKINNGKLIKIYAPLRTHKKIMQEANNDIEMYNKIKLHKSEIALDEYNKYDLYIDNDNSTIKEITKLCENIIPTNSFNNINKQTDYYLRIFNFISGIFCFIFILVIIYIFFVHWYAV